MTRVSRNVKEGMLNQGAGESINYTLTTTPWGSSPTNVVVTAIDRTNNDADVTSTVVNSSAGSTNGDVITTPLIENLTADHIYRIYVQFKIGIKTLRAYFEIEAEL
jgi:hypothetical protein